MTAVILFGATGDLSRRMLLPSLYGLSVDGLLAPSVRIVGTARSALDDASGVQRRAAELLGMKPTTLNERMKRLGFR